MKSLILILSSLILSNLALAQSAPSTSVSQPLSTMIGGGDVEGFRISLLKPSMKIKTSVSINVSGGGGASGSDTTHIDEVWGLAVGYAHLPIRELGWTTNLNWQNLVDEDDGERLSATMMSLDGNLGYAFNEVFSLKGGLNISKFTRADSEIEKFEPELGTQLSAGFQITKNFGVDLAWVRTLQKRDDVDLTDDGLGIPIKGDLEFVETSTAVTLHATF